jgi:enoyl-CoA hydratase
MTDSEIVTYALRAGVAHIQMDDGKANVMSERMLQALHAAFERAQTDRAVVLLAGRARMFSGGYDLAMFQRGQPEIVRTLRAGAELVERIASFPYPVVAACTGHAIAQGAFTLLAADERIGAAGAFKLGLNEVAIGLTIPHYGVELARMRLSAPWFQHATITGAIYDPEQALRAGFLDEVCEPDAVLARAEAAAQRLTKLDMAAHAGTKLRVRGPALAKIREGIDSELRVP